MLDSADGDPVALLWWFGDPDVLGEILRTECARNMPVVEAAAATASGADATAAAAAASATAARTRHGRVVWVHSGAAGVENILKQAEVREGAMPLTNAKGAFSASLGEWAIFGCMWRGVDSSLPPFTRPTHHVQVQEGGEFSKIFSKDLRSYLTGDPAFYI